MLAGTPVLAMSVSGMLAMKEQFPLAQHHRASCALTVADPYPRYDIARHVDHSIRPSGVSTCDTPTNPDT
jgi:hypothetical protein